MALPANYQWGTRVTGAFWTYPREYQDFEDYQNEAMYSHNHNAFPI